MTWPDTVSILAVLVLAAGCDAGRNAESPQACMPVEAVTLHIGETTRFTACFVDYGNEGTLVYEAMSSAPSVVKATATTAKITLEALAVGEATITISATNEEGRSGDMRFVATVPNRAGDTTGRR